MFRQQWWMLLCVVLVACSAPQQQRGQSVADAIRDVEQREIRFPDYPSANRTYLSFSKAHGFQVNYIDRGNEAWLWYHGNARGVPEIYKLDQVSGQAALCWRHPSNSYNPATGHSGGRFACTPLEFAKKTVIADLSGDVFDLASGAVPYRLDRCVAPDAFQFDRDRFRC